jgi:hypothetical protein
VFLSFFFLNQDNERFKKDVKKENPNWGWGRARRRWNRP